MSISRSIIKKIAAFLSVLLVFPFVNRKVLYKNLRIAFPDKEYGFYNKIIFSAVRHFCAVFWDVLLGIESSHISALIQDAANSSMDVNQNYIIATAHIGNWEAANLSAGRFFKRYGVIVNERKSPVLFFIYQQRAMTGAEIYKAGDPAGLRALVREMQRGLTAAVVFDHTGRDGVFAQFFSRPAPIPKGLLWLCKKTKTDLVPCFCIRERGKYRLHVYDKISYEEGEKEIAKKLNEVLEEEVNSYPEQYLWSYKRWKYSNQRDVLVLSDGKKGHEKQSFALLEYIKRAYPDKDIQINQIVLRNISWTIKVIGFLPIRFGEYILKRNGLEPILRQNADLVVSTGSSLSGLNVFLKRYNQAKSCVVMSPGMFSPFIDAVLAMRHDRGRGRNCYLIDGALCFFDEDKAGQFAKEFKLKKDEDNVCVLIGGNTKGYDIHFAGIEDMLNTLSNSNKRVLITTSRRTPADVELLIDKRDFQYKVIANRYNPEGILDAFFYVSRKAIITPDSISMISEAINAGLDVGVWAPFLPNRPKFKRFLLQQVSLGKVCLLKTSGDLKAFLHKPIASEADRSQSSGITAFLRSKALL